MKLVREKHILLGLIFFAISLLLSHSVFSQDDFSITVDDENINFGLMQTGGIKGDEPSQGINVTCRTTWNSGWFLRIYMQEPLRLDGYSYITIPNENFYWYGMNTTGIGTLVTNEEDFSEEKVVYQAPAGEGADGIDVRIRFKVKIPQYQAKGRYEGTITLALIQAV